MGKNPGQSVAAWSGVPEHPLQLDPEDIGALYSSAFLLERDDRLEESAAAWRAIIDWNDARTQTLETEWPRRELARLRAELAARRGDR